MAKDNKKNQSKANKVNPVTATFAELKQVSWPTFAQTMKRLAAVLVVTLVFLVVLMGVDALLGFIHGEFFKMVVQDSIYLTTSQIVAMVIGILLILVAIVGTIVYKVKKNKSRGE